MLALQTLLAPVWLGTPIWIWCTFFVLVLALLALDLGLLHRGEREIGMRESLLLYAGYSCTGLLFGVWIWYELGAQLALEFYTGLLIEQSLSMDNVFVMAMVLGAFQVPRPHQHRVLFWGIVGVIVLRAVMIGLGVALVHRFGWVLYFFGAFLLVSGLRMLFQRRTEEAPRLAGNAAIGWLRRRLRVTDQLHGRRFLVRLPRADGRRVLHATPLFLALVVIELMDLVFAVDSVPAVFAVSQDPFVIYTSNIFAILGLRSLYFALAALMHRFVYLRHALALVLAFIGGKIMLQPWLTLPAALSLGITLTLLAGGLLWSLVRTRTAGAEGR